MGTLLEQLQRRKMLGLCVGLLVAAVGLLLYAAGWLDIYEHKTLDLRFRTFRHGEQADPAIVIADINEQGLTALESRIGRWPWPRSVHGMVIDYLARCGAKLIAYDILFPEQSFSVVKPEKLTTIVTFIDSVITKADSGFAVQNDLRRLQTAVGRLEMADDDRFGQAAGRSGRVIQALHFGDNEGDTVPVEILERISLASIGSAGRDFIRMYGPLLPIEPLRQGALGMGHINMTPDDDGPVRSMGTVIRYPQGGRDYYLPAMALGMLAALDSGNDQARMGDLLRSVTFNDGAYHMGERRILADARGRLLINYAGPQRSYPYISYAQLVLDAVSADQGKEPYYPPELLQDKIIIVGTSAAGLMDLRVSPFEALYPGVEIHANLLDQMLHNRYLRHNGLFWLVFLVLVLNGGLGLLVGRVSPLKGALVTLALLAVYGAVSFLVFREFDYWLDTALPVVSLAATYLLVILYRFFSEEKEKRFIRHAFQHYLAADVVNMVLEHREALKLGGERRVLTVLFSDIRSFTTMSENMQPEEVVARLNEYLTAMTEIVLKYRGMLDKYVGDELMAVFGAPLDQRDHAVRACLAGLEMMDVLRAMQEQWERDGVPVINIGIGINTGPMFVGNMGSKQLFDYTVIGDNVNLGARLEGTNKLYGTHIIISEYTHHLVQDRFITRYLGEEVVKGKVKPVKIYELVGQQDGAGGTADQAG